MFRLMRSLHNYLGLILGIQIGLWFISGFVMAYLPIEEVRGNHLKISPQTSWHLAATSPSSVLRSYDKDASLSFSQRVIVNSRSGENGTLSSIPVYQITDDGSIYRYNAQTGGLLSALDEDAITALATHQYQGDGNVVTTALIDELPQEVQNLTAPLWQVQFDDELETRFYLDPNTGSVIRVRTDTWRLFDFMWMLHIMDYEDRSNFNSPLLLTFSGSAVLFTLTGLILLYQRFRPRRNRSIFRR